MYKYDTDSLEMTAFERCVLDFLYSQTYGWKQGRIDRSRKDPKISFASGNLIDFLPSLYHITQNPLKLQQTIQNQTRISIKVEKNRQ